MKKHLSTILLSIVFLLGLSLLLYPTVSDYWNSFHQSRAVAAYAEMVADINEERYQNLWNHASIYNQKLARRGFDLALSDSQLREYNEELDVTGTGIMAYIQIPQINVLLPIYHGTSDEVLTVAIGHLPGTSLPVGGPGTHCVLSGHRGLPSARLFTDIDQLAPGDTFQIRTLDEVLTYEVDQILIVLPYELESLEIAPGEDYCTLVTCTPYGVNSHRLLVRGHRVETVVEKVIRVTPDAQQIEPMLVAPLVAAPMLLVLLIRLLTTGKKKKK